MKNKVRRFLAGSVLLGTVLTAGTTFAATTNIVQKPKMRAPSVIGTVSTINGETLIISSKIKRKGDTAYTVDATNAKILRAGTSTSITSIAIGDTVTVQGTINGSNVSATVIRDNPTPKTKSKKITKKIIKKSAITVTNTSN